MDFDCLFIPHADTGLRYATIELYGRYEQHHALQFRAGNMVRFDHLIETTERQPKTPDGLGRVLGGTWTWGTSVGASEIQKIGVIRILRYDTYLFFEGEESNKNRCSYVFNRQVKDWLGGAMYELSFNGSIRRRKFRNSENVLFRSRIARTESFKNYFYKQGDDDDHLTRFGIPAIEVVWRHGAAFDHERHMKIAKTLLEFVHGVELAPITRYTAIGGNAVVSVWPTDIDRQPTRPRFEGPIFFNEVPDFLRSALKALNEGDQNIDVVEDAIYRYVHATTKVTVEQSFSSGCEAIEALFKLVNPGREELTDTSKILLAGIKSLARRLVSTKAGRAEINGRIKNALLPGLWPKIYGFVRSSRAAIDPECEALIARCQFHRYRSRFIHGARAASNHEMFVQRDLMDYVFVSLFLHLLRDRTRRSPITHLLRSELGGVGTPIRLIQIYD